MAFSKEKQQKLVSSLTNIGALAGTNEIGVAGGIEGLGLSTAQALCDNEAKTVRDGLFKVAIMGTFSSGKSTVINALIGAKILPEASIPCTAILTYIQYGRPEDENRVDVYMADGLQKDGSIKTGDCIQMSVEDFQEEYKYTLDDELEFRNTGKVERFARVKHAVMYCSQPLMEGGICIIDSPGLEDKAIATELAMKVAKESQAIVYVCTDKGYGQPDKDYIASAFYNCPNNVFFVINKFDLVSKDGRPEALAKAKMDTETVFTTEEKVNTELQDRRVFGVSALRALDSRRGMTYDREEEEEKPLNDTQRKSKFEKSWFGPFEQELEKFLTTDDKCIAQYQKCFKQMASTYRDSEAKIAEYLHIYQNQLDMDENSRMECESIIRDIKTSIRLTEETFDNCSLLIQNAVTTMLNGCATQLDKSWEQDMEDLAQKVDIGTFKYMCQGFKLMNPFSSREKKEASMREFMGKFLDVVTEYYADKVETYIRNNMSVVDTAVEEAQNKLDVRFATTKGLFDDLSGKLTHGGNGAVEGQTHNSNWLQVIISAYLGDYSQMVRGQYEKVPWIDFLKKTLLNTVWQSMLLIFIDGGIGVAIALAIEYLQGTSNKNETVKKMLATSKDGIVKAIRCNIEESTKSINKKVAVRINEEKVKKCTEAKRSLNDKQTEMAKIEEFFADHTTTLESERDRFDHILDAMFSEAKVAYKEVFGRQLELEAFKQM